MSCPNIQSNLHDFIEGALAPREQQRVEIHLKDCTICQKEFAEIKNTIELTRNLEELDPPSFLVTRIMANVREENQKQTKFFRFFLTPVRIPAGALALFFIIFFSLAVYQLFNSIDKNAGAPQISEIDRSQLPKDPTKPDQPSEALVKHQQTNLKELKDKKNQLSKDIDIKQLQQIMNEGQFDFEVTIVVNNVPSSAQEVLRHMIQIDGNILKAELLEKEYRISAGIKSTRKADLIEKLKMVGEIEQVSDRQSALQNLRVRIRIVENKKSP
jgi:hypothetical protein